MMHFRGAAIAATFALVAVASATSAQSQSTVPQKSLDDYLKANPWDSSKNGPLMVVDGSNALGVAASSDVSGFKRQTIPCGSITAMVPNSMVILDGSLNTPLTLYDALTRGDKVLYLMSTLTGPQWKLAATKGIGIENVTGDQRTMLQSIVPNTLSVVYSKVSSDGTSLVPFDRKFFSETDFTGIRLHFVREMSVQVRHGDGNGFVTETGHAQDRCAPGDLVIQPDGYTENESNSAFANSVRKTAPNFLKRSDLYYDGPIFSPICPLPSNSTIKELLAKISSLVGLTLQSDARAAAKQVEFFGLSARCGDVLKALALSQTGTFRKIGDRYLLTSDIEGLGARQVKVGSYAENLEKIVSTKRNEWRTQVARSGNLREVSYSPTDALAPTPAAKSWIDSHRQSASVQTQDSISADKLPAQWQIVLHRTADISDKAPDLSNLRLGERLRWDFILPDGNVLDWGASFPCQAFEPSLAAISDGPGPAQARPIPLGTELKSAVILKFGDPQSATSKIEQIKNYGISEVWAETLDAQSIRVAIALASKNGMKVRLFIRPWEFWPKSDLKTLELNILGETPLQASQRQFRSDLWAGLSQSFGIPSLEALPLISPISAEIPARWALFRQLTSLPGLEGVVMSDTEPPGYEPARFSEDNDLFGTGIASIADLGYTDQERLQFLDKYGVDPVDLTQGTDVVPIDFSVPTFAGAIESSPDLLLAWDQLRAANNLSQIEALLDGIAAPILIEPRRYTKHFMPSGITFVEPMLIGQGIPHSDPIYDLRSVDLGVGIPIFRISPTPTAAETANVLKNIRIHSDRNLVSFDLSAIPMMSLQGSLSPFLDRKETSIKDKAKRRRD